MIPADLLETACQTLGLSPYPVQVKAAQALAEGKLIEMKTGEGKTLTAVFPAAIHALKGGQVHILTFNDYLAKRDAEWMKPFYKKLGLTVNHVTADLSEEERKQAYTADIVYTTAKQIGFDYLRSYIAATPDQILLPQLDFALVDEADAILIDEARNPLILAGSTNEPLPDLFQIDQVILSLDPDADFSLDDYQRNIFLNEEGIEKVERVLGLDNLYAPENRLVLSAVNLSLHAHYLLCRDKDYIVKSKQVLLVDEFTGRIVKDRRWQYGLQMAVEVKEGIVPREEGIMLGSITLPELLRKYKKLAGMTATAAESADEFEQLYQLQIESIPPNLPSIRQDLPDRIYPDSVSKIKDLISRIKTVHQSGQPILIGTLTVKESEDLSTELKRAGLSVRILNAHNDEEEAAIIAEAGDLGAITISTNMAGRGTDIRLGGKNEANREAVIRLGGLLVIGTNRHESKRIDNQLRGRSGRQGDPGMTQFYISFEDDLMIRYRLQKLLPKKFRNNNKTGLVDHKTVRNRIDQAQRIIEGQMEQLRNTLRQYAAIVDKQREVYMHQRQCWLYTDHPARFSIMKLYTAQWAAFLDYAQEVKEGIYLLRLGGENPERKFNQLMDTRFKDMLKTTEEQIADILLHPDEFITKPSPPKPGSTWNYVVNDSPFQNQFAINLLSMSLMGSSRISL